ncbi:MAG TPA: dephospho-CoA kinase [Candidatus Binatia bacterium]|nr:dephospho-CoA kinase [Candidatus Binatia bacterium]
MRVIGLVGGIGSGKSTVAGLLAGLGGAVIDADAIGHGVYRAGTPGFEAVVAAFGPEIVGADGEIDRRRLGAIVFGDEARLRELNGIAHPLIRAEIARRIAALRAEGRSPAVVVEAAILLEAGWRDLVDEVWVVSTGKERVIARIEEQRGLSAPDIEARMARQMADATRRAAADLVIENDGSLAELEQRVSEAWRRRVARA